MDDDEEVDIIGIEAYDDISNITSGQLLSCDYTVHPNWVNDNPDGNNFWSASVPKNENLESNVEVLHSDEIVIEEPEPIPALIDSEWGREQITSPTDVIFEEDIPASIEEIVANEEEDDENSKSPFKQELTLSQDSETQENETYFFEPAAYETHPLDQNIKYIGPTNERSLLKVKIARQLPMFSPHSCEPRTIKAKSKTISNGQQSSNKFKKSIKINLEKDMARNIFSQKVFKQKIQQKFNKNFKTLRKRRKSSNKNSVSKKALLGQVRKSGTNIKFGKNITINHETIKELEDEILSGTIVKVDKCEEESDIEIDVEDIEEVKDVGNSIKNIVSTESNSCDKLTLISKKDGSEIEPKLKKLEKIYENISEELMKQLKDMNVPTEELKINPKEVSELEKFVHYEFFDGRITKTQEQYFRIRNHILGMWCSMKPKYVSKTAVRNGLKHGGDVNSIGRIHRLLEQIGAINFGHEGNQFEYIRPLEDFIAMCTQQATRYSTSISANKKTDFITERRQRVRNNKSFSFLGQDTIDDANYTISHMDGVIRPDPPRLNTDTECVISRNVKSEFDLVKCLRFSNTNLAPFKVSMTLSTLLCLQLHSFTSNHEVMGFLGGYCSKSIGRNKISLTRYKPCRTSEQSSTMCEMCPISQVEQSSSLVAEGFELLGWFHSHPSFPASPSRTDIRTQREMQQQFSIENNKPFVGVILSCLDLVFKCMYIIPKDLQSDLNDDALAYELEVDIIKDCTNLKNDVKDVLITFQTNFGINSNEIIDKFKRSSEKLLNRFGYNVETFYDSVF